MTSIKYLVLLILVALAAYGFIAASSPAESRSAEAAADVVYLCRETKALIKLPAQPIPAVNPQTGRSTLVRALYCPACRKWHAVPPPEVFPGHPLRYPCPKHHRPMSAEGPMDAK